MALESNEDNALFHYNSPVWQSSKPIGDNDYSLRAKKNDINRVHQAFSSVFAERIKLIIDNTPFVFKLPKEAMGQLTLKQLVNVSFRQFIFPH